VGDETVLIHLRNKKIYVLNPSGGFFWHGLDGDRETGELLAGVPLADALAENASERVEAFLRDLQEADLVEAGSATSDRTGSSPEFPLAAFVPPELVWQQELRNFGQSCAFISGSSAACDSVPTT
jgi:hypothetical protein